MKKHLPLLGCVVAIATGCAPLPPPTSVTNRAAPFNTVTRDEFKKVTTVRGDRYEFFSHGNHVMWFHGAIHDSGSNIFGIYLSSAYATQGRWQDAYDIEGAKYTLSQFSAKGGASRIYEVQNIAFIEIPLEEIRAKAKALWRIKVENASSDVILEIQPAWTTGFLKSVDGVKK